jgi:microcystin-dependent protein
MGIKLTNNAFGTLAAGINSSATSITLTSGQGARFPTLSAGDYFYATLIDTSNNLEIVKCTARSTDVLTVVRAQESTTARAYNTGDRIEIRLTAQTFIDASSGYDNTTSGLSATTTQGAIDELANDLANFEAIPPGAVQFFARNSAPTGWLKANGAAVSRTTYAALFSSIGTTFGAGNGSTTFLVPDLRGEFPRGWDDGRGVDSGRVFGSAQGHGIPRMRGGVTDSHGNAAMGAYNVSGFTNPFVNAGGDSSYRTALQAATTPSVYVEFDSDRVIPASADVRPRNIALLACIKF